MQFLMDHIVLNVADEEQMIGFYRDVLGMPMERLAAFREGKVPFPSARLNDDTIIDFFPQKLWQETVDPQCVRVNLNHFCLVLPGPDWRELRQRLERHGVTIEDGPVKRWGAHGTGVSIYFRDPENNLIEVRHYPEREDAGECLLGS